MTINHTTGIELQSVIQQLRFDIEQTWRTAWSGSTPPSVVFEVGPVELEITVAVALSSDAKFGVKFWVVDAGVAGGIDQTTTQRISLTLTPRDPRHPSDRLAIGAKAAADEYIPPPDTPVDRSVTAP